MVYFGATYVFSSLFKLKYILIMLGLSINSFYSEFIMNRALYMISAAKAAPLLYIEIILCFVFDIFIFDKNPTILNILGTLIVIFCCYRITII